MLVFFLTNMDTTKPTPPVAYQIPLRPALPCIYGPVEYRDERDLYERVDRLLHSTDIEREYIAAAFAQSGHDWSTATPAAIDRFGLYATIGLRSAVARSLTGLSLRGLTTRAADSTTLAWFLGTADIEPSGVPPKAPSIASANRSMPPPCVVSTNSSPPLPSPPSSTLEKPSDSPPASTSPWSRTTSTSTPPA